MAYFKEPQKFRRKQKGVIGNPTSRGTELKFGSYGLRVLKEGKLSSNELETIRLMLVRTLQKQGKVWWRIQLDYPKTSKSVGVRMGKGKGSKEGWQARIRRNRIIVELDHLSLKLAMFALNKIRYKLSLPVSIVVKDV